MDFIEAVTVPTVPLLPPVVQHSTLSLYLNISLRLSFLSQKNKDACSLQVAFHHQLTRGLVTKLWALYGYRL